MKVSLPYIQQYRNRHGKLYTYFRPPGGKKFQLPDPSSSDFVTAYDAALSGIRFKPSKPVSPAGSVSAAITAYYLDNSFLSLAPGTRSMRRAILERWRAQDGNKPLALFQPKHVAARLGQMRPFAARNWLKTLRGLMKFVLAHELVKADPTASFELVEAKAGTIHTWTEDEIAVFERAYSQGTRTRLAFDLLLYTAMRRGDVIRLGPQHIRAGRLRYVQAKTGRALEIPIHPALAQTLLATPSTHLTFLVTAHGKPFTAAGFGNWFRQMCDEAGLPQCSAHGLRKAQARRLAEAGCTVHEIAAITGHKTLKEVQRYTDAADQVRLAQAAIARTSSVHPSAPECPPSLQVVEK